jgi:hypothetical protein
MAGSISKRGGVADREEVLHDSRPATQAKPRETYQLRLTGTYAGRALDTLSCLRSR